MANKKNIKQGGGADVRSPVYPTMGGLAQKPYGISRACPFRGEPQRSYGNRKGR